jgi:co-chaperonin GroES (HSP10)
MPALVVRHIKPLGPRILVRIQKLEDRSATGLFLPAGAKEEHDDALYAEVVEVARAEARFIGVEDDDKTRATLGENVSGVPLGSFVLIPKKAGTRVPWDDQLRLIDVREVLATVDEIDSEEIQ